MRSFSIDEWCALHGISRPQFYILDKEGKAPKTFVIGQRRRRISEQANADWIAALEAAPLDERTAAVRSASGLHAVGRRKDRRAAA
jgi:predicted DNA-binding transcriptional regulator AlpA